MAGDYDLRRYLAESGGPPSPALRRYLGELQANEDLASRVSLEFDEGLLLPTTRAYLHPENETRLLSLRVDDSPEHTAAVLLSVARRGNVEADYSEWRALQTWIAGQDNRVVVPFAETLARMIPPVDLRIRRDFELLLNAIRSHAILHQATRSRDTDGHIIATLDDYTAVRGLVGDVMSAAVATKIPPQLRTVVSAVAALIEDDEPTSARRVQGKTGFSKSQAAHWLKTASGEGYLVNENEGQRGKAAVWKVGAELPGDEDLLPTVDALRESVRVSGVSGQGVKAPGRVPEKVSGQLSGPPFTEPDTLVYKHTMHEDLKPIAGFEPTHLAEKVAPHTPAGHSGHPDTLSNGDEIAPAGHPPGQLPGHFALNIGDQGWPPGVYPEDPDELVAAILADGHDMATVRAALRRRGVPIPLDVERLCVDVKADAIAAGNAEIVRQGLEPTIANNAAIDWPAVWAVETRHVVRRIQGLRRAGHEHVALALMRELPAPDEPADDVQEEWAMLNRPFDYHMYEREAYALYAESVTDYPMGAAMVSTGYPVKPRKTESERPM